MLSGQTQQRKRQNQKGYKRPQEKENHRRIAQRLRIQFWLQHEPPPQQRRKRPIPAVIGIDDLSFESSWKNPRRVVVDVAPTEQSNSKHQGAAAGRQESGDGFPVSLGYKIQEQRPPIQLQPKRHPEEKSAHRGAASNEAIDRQRQQKQQEKIVLAVQEVAVQRPKPQER